jgi:hypothetical protein
MIRLSTCDHISGMHPRTSGRMYPRTPARSWLEAACATFARPSPKLSVRMCRSRSSSFLPASCRRFLALVVAPERFAVRPPDAGPEIWHFFDAAPPGPRGPAAFSLGQQARFEHGPLTLGRVAGIGAGVQYVRGTARPSSQSMRRLGALLPPLRSAR